MVSVGMEEVVWGGGKIIIGRRPWREPISTHCPAKAPISLMQPSLSYSQRPSGQRLCSNKALASFLWEMLKCAQQIFLVLFLKEVLIAQNVFCAIAA